MQNQRRINRDLQDASSSLQGIGISTKDGRLDLLFANICFDLQDPSLVIPCLVHLEPDYPVSPPNVGFPVDFPYHMGASYTKTDGPLKDCQVLCLNITGNFKEIHTEWSTEVGEGWSPSMTLSGLLVQLQSVLMEMRSSLRGQELSKLRKRLEAFTFQVDEEHVHTFNAPYPNVFYNEQRPAATNPAEPCDGVRCYITGATEWEDVLGIGFSVDGKGGATTPAEVLSWTAFDKRGVRQSSSKEEFQLFWPRLPAAAPRSPHFACVLSVSYILDILSGLGGSEMCFLVLCVNSELPR